MWLANQNCVTLHAWLSRRDELNTPDQIGLRPRPVRRRLRAWCEPTARAVADVLDDLGLAAYLQTTGSRGLHVVTPLQR